jgi:hypothetical protein
MSGMTYSAFADVDIRVFYLGLHFLHHSHVLLVALQATRRYYYR